MKKLYIIKAGTTFPATLNKFGDFDTWTLDGLGTVNLKTAVKDAEHGEALTATDQCRQEYTYE